MKVPKVNGSVKNLSFEICTCISLALMLSLIGAKIVYAFSPDRQASTQVQKTPQQKQIQTNTLIVGSEQDFPPFATGMTDETASGFTIELWKAVATEAGLNYHIRVLPFTELLQEFKTGKIDVLINLNITDEAQAYADFSVPHAIFKGGIFVRKNESSVNSESDLNDKSIIMIKDDVEASYATSRGWDKQLVLVHTAEEGMRLLASGKHDAMLVNKVVGLQSLASNGINNIKALKVNAGFTQKFAFAVHDGESDLLSKINEAFVITKANKTYDSIYEKWFGIYSEKEIGLRDLLKHIIPIVLLFTCVLAYSLFRRRAERKQAELLLRSRQQQLNFVLEASGLGFWDWHISSGEVERNNIWAEMLGYTYEEIKHTINQWADFVHPDDVENAWKSINDVLEGRTSVHELVYRMRTKRGDYKWILDRAKVVERDAEGKAVRMIGSHRDYTERKNLELELTRQAHLDYLTGLSNRRHFMEQAEIELSRAIRYNTQLSVLMLDIDFFKNVNDTYGHQVGDAVLQALSKICQETLRQVDIAGRIGGEEFAILLPEAEVKEALEVAERLRETVAKTEVDIPVGLPIQFTVSIGVAAVINKNVNIDTLLNQADKALYKAKETGRNKVCVY